MLVATTMLRGETGEELCFFVQVLDVEASPDSPWRRGLEHRPVIDSRQNELAMSRPGQRLDVACHIRGMPGRDELSLHSKIPTVNSRA